MRTTALLLVALLGGAAALAGCKDYHYVVRKDKAPLYSDEDRSEVIARMDRLADGFAGHDRPDREESLVKIRYRGLKGWVDKSDLRIFRCDESETRSAHERVVGVNRREVILEEKKDWSPATKQAIREDRVENGMSKDMIELAWGRPASVEKLADGGERWQFRRTHWDVHEDVHYDYYPGGSRLYYGYGPWGPSWGYGFEMSRVEPRYYRTYFQREEKRSVTFGPEGKVVGWETTER